MAAPERLMHCVFEAEPDVTVASPVQSWQHLQFYFVISPHFRDDVLAKTEEKALEDGPDDCDERRNILSDWIQLSLKSDLHWPPDRSGWLGYG